MPIKVTFNSTLAAKALNGGRNARQAAFVMRKEYEAIASEAHRKALQSFKRHEVTREIKAGPLSSNRTGALAYGNLFSFIGFNMDEEPIAPIQDVFEREFKYKVRKRNSTGGYRITIQIPDINELRELSPIPWAQGFSWIDGIENGMPNFGKYLYAGSTATFKNSNSGPAIQVKGIGTSLAPNEYVSRIIERAKYNLEQ